MKEAKHRQILLLALCLALGCMSDFILVGVFKVIWIAIYGTTYIALAMTIETMVARSNYKNFSKRAVISFLLGTALAHLVFVDHHRHDIYNMTLISENPLVFKSADFPEFFYLTSPQLSQTLAAGQRQEDIIMKTDTLSDYGCRKTFTIDSMDGIDVRNDSQANWTLRLNKLGTFARPNLPTTNDDDQWIWCRLKFYRTNF